MQDHWLIVSITKLINNVKEIKLIVFYIQVNDIAGSFSGVVFGITNTFGTMPGIICPYIVGVLTQNVCININFSLFDDYNKIFHF